MRYNTRVYHEGPDYPRTQKTHLPAQHTVILEFNAFVIELKEEADGILGLIIAANEKNGHHLIAPANGRTGAIGEPSRAYAVGVLVLDEEGRPRGSLQPAGRKNRKGGVSGKSTDGGE